MPKIDYIQCDIFSTDFKVFPSKALIFFFFFLMGKQSH